MARVVMSLTGQARSLAERLPEQIKTELATAAGRLTSARSPQQLAEALEAELARMLSNLVPVLARTPFPARSPGAARLVVAGAAGTAGATWQLNQLSLATGASVAATPAVVGSLLLAWIIEVWAAVAVRIHQLEQAGREPDRAQLAAEVARAVMGSASPVVPRQLAVSVGRGVSTRMARRWTVGLVVPVVGALYDAYDAQSTVAAVVRFPVQDHPRRGDP